MSKVKVGNMAPVSNKAIKNALKIKALSYGQAAVVQTFVPLPKKSKMK